MKVHLAHFRALHKNRLSQPSRATTRKEKKRRVSRIYFNGSVFVNYYPCGMILAETQPHCSLVHIFYLSYHFLFLVG
jgi:hypothetical protein